MENNNERNASIIKYSAISIAVNVVLSAVKLAAGYLAHSHAVMLDGVDSLSDCFASLIAILSAKFGSRRGDKAHPLGYGRLEYLGSMMIAIVIIFISVRAAADSVKALAHPHEAPEYNTLIIAIMVISLAFKSSYGILMRIRGRQLNSIGLVLAGSDSIADALTSVGILAAIVIYRLTGFDIEHYVCIIISVMIIKTGLEMARACLLKLLGTRTDPEVRKELVNTIIAEDEVLNVFNVVIHNYGENNNVGSVDIEVEGSMTAAEAGRLSRRIIRKAGEKGIILTSVGISGTNTGDPKIAEMLDSILATARRHPVVKHIYAFTVDKKEKVISFDIVPDYSDKQRDEDIEAFISEVSRVYPKMKIDVHLAVDM